MKLSRYLHPVKAAVLYIAISSIAVADGVSGIFSCSSSKSGGRPTSYAFNTTVMVRDSEGSIPFRFIGKIEETKYLYSGFTKSALFDSLTRAFGATQDSLTAWSIKGIKSEFNPRLLEAADIMGDAPRVRSGNLF